MLSEEDQATATGNMHKTIGQCGHTVFALYNRTDKHTDAQTYSSQYFTTLLKQSK